MIGGQFGCQLLGTVGQGKSDSEEDGIDNLDALLKLCERGIGYDSVVVFFEGYVGSFGDVSG